MAAKAGLAVTLVFVCSVTVALILCTPKRGVTQDAVYVGSEACADCHDVEYENYSKYSKKAHSGESVRIMAGDLTKSELEECFTCHTTGYGQPGGFVSFEETPTMANAGCETCHGPGSLHVESMGDKEYIKYQLVIEDCTHCHNSDRVAAFDFKPMLFGGAH